MKILPAPDGSPARHDYARAMKTRECKEVACFRSLRLQRHVSALLKDVRMRSATVQTRQNEVQLDPAVRRMTHEILNSVEPVGPRKHSNFSGGSSRARRLAPHPTTFRCLWTGASHPHSEPSMG